MLGVRLVTASLTARPVPVARFNCSTAGLTSVHALARLLLYGDQRVGGTVPLIELRLCRFMLLQTYGSMTSSHFGPQLVQAGSVARLALHFRSGAGLALIILLCFSWAVCVH